MKRAYRATFSIISPFHFAKWIVVSALHCRASLLTAALTTGIVSFPHADAEIANLTENLLPRQVETINRDWKFSLGDHAGAEARKFDDSMWESVGLPHSFSMPYFLSKDFYVGYGWYRKTLEIPKEWLSKAVFLEFDGVFQEAEIYINGVKVGDHKGGYTGFSVDISKAIQPGANQLSVRVNNLWNPRLAPRAGEHVFSGGIYRNVRLVVTDPLHVAWYGTQITTPVISAESAVVNVKTEVVNSGSESKSCTLHTAVIDPDGRQVCDFESTMPVDAGAMVVFDQTSKPIPNPKLWHPDHPHLYSVQTTVMEGKKPVDRFVSPLGFRWFQWTADKGFFLNGEHYYFHGANVHQDHAGWGDAVTDAGAWRDVKMVKDAGFNLIRGSHYPHSPAFSEACDKQGMLLWSENCFWGIGGFRGEGYWDSSAYPPKAEDQPEFEASVKETLREMIRIHRNHPSVAVWSMTNEAFFVDDELVDKTKDLISLTVALSHELDPSRAAAVGGAQRRDFDKLGDIAGYNGDGARVIDPGVPSVVSEYGSAVCDRATGKFEPNFGELQAKPNFPWRAGQVIWCMFDHGSIAGTFGCMGIVDFFRLPKKGWYWYRNEYRHIPAPEWPTAGTAAKLRLTADKSVIHATDGTDDTHVVVTILDAAGKPISNSPPVTLTIESGPGEFPTGQSISFAPNSDIPIMEGIAAIEFRSYFGGKTLIRATSPGLADATLAIETVGAPAFTPDAKAHPRAYTRFVNPSLAFLERGKLGRNNPTKAISEAKDHPGRLANDGNKATSWQPASANGPAWWQVDIERRVELTSVQWIFGEGSDSDYKVEVSDDQASWSQVATGKASAHACKIDLIPKGSAGRFLRISFSASENPITIREMEMSGSSAN